MNEDLEYTMQIDTNERMDISIVIHTVYEALLEKGYDPINQLTGYILSGDTGYITSYKDARNLIKKYERDQILEEVMRYYIKR